MILQPSAALDVMILSGEPDTVPTYTPTGVWIGTGLFLAVLISVVIEILISARRGSTGIGRHHHWLRRRRR